MTKEGWVHSDKGGEYSQWKRKGRVHSDTDEGDSKLHKGERIHSERGRGEFTAIQEGGFTVK